MRFGKLNPKAFLHKLPIGNCVVCPGIGEDDAYVKVEGEYLVIHSDPITETGKDAGYLSVVVACNDVNMKGVECKSIITTLLLHDEESLSPVIDGISEACNILKCKVVGGHTEITKGLDRDIVVTTAFSFSNQVLRLSDARENDYIVLFGNPGIEGTWILANEYEDELSRLGVSRNLIERAKRFKYLIPVQDKVMKVKDYAISMHDATEGGIYQALLEVAQATNLRVVVEKEKIPLLEETVEITKALNINPLTLISSGAFIVIARDYEKLTRLGGVLIGKLKKDTPALEVNGEIYTEDFEEELVRFEGYNNGGR
ncbi:AIR synthase [Sulfolobus acidocaldarius SUSAZ]|nr:AIR synthase [Sulfolobus acidocaldarius SUSAZ]